MKGPGNAIIEMIDTIEIVTGPEIGKARETRVFLKHEIVIVKSVVVMIAMVTERRVTIIQSLRMNLDGTNLNRSIDVQKLKMKFNHMITMKIAMDLVNIIIPVMRIFMIDTSIRSVIMIDMTKWMRTVNIIDQRGHIPGTINKYFYSGDLLRCFNCRNDNCVPLFAF